MIFLAILSVLVNSFATLSAILLSVSATLNLSNKLPSNNLANSSFSDSLAVFCSGVSTK